MEDEEEVAEEEEEEEMPEEVLEEIEEEVEEEEAEEEANHSTTYQGYGKKAKSEAVPSPDSKFLLVVCPKCKNKQVIFSKTATKVVCQKCGAELSMPTGGDSMIDAKIERVLG